MLPPSHGRDAGYVSVPEERCVATRRGSAVAVSIHRDGVPVVGSLSRFRRSVMLAGRTPACRTSRPGNDARIDTVCEGGCGETRTGLREAVQTLVVTPA